MWIVFREVNSRDGSQRLHEGTTTQVKTFLGEYSDPSGLSYLNARYYSPVQGRFISQDEVFLIFGTDISGDQRQALSLLDPQLQNSYSYAKNNPVTYKDDNGKFLPIIAAYLVANAAYFIPVAIVAGSASTLAVAVPLYYGEVSSYASGDYNTAQQYSDGVMMSLGFALELGSAAMSFAPATSCTVPATTSASSYRFGDRIENTPYKLEKGSARKGYGFDHIIADHTVGTTRSSVGLFNPKMSNDDIKNSVLDAVKNGTGWYQHGGKNVLEYDTGIPDFGTKTTGENTSWLKVVADPRFDNSITSAYPMD